jgi:predicted small lipoprotein YifL
MIQKPAQGLFSNSAALACAVVSLLLLVAACGQRGPLYLPERTPMVVGDPQAEDAQAEDAEEDAGETDEEHPDPRNPGERTP